MSHLLTKFLRAESCQFALSTNSIACTILTLVEDGSTVDLLVKAIRLEVNRRPIWLDGAFLEHTGRTVG